VLSECHVHRGSATPTCDEYGTFGDTVRRKKGATNKK
jgi:hypothetical protein